MPDLPRIAAVLLAATLLAGCGGEAFQPTHTTAVPLVAGSSLGQTFRPGTGSLAGVDLLVATFGREVGAEGTLTLTLRDGTGGQVLAVAAVAGDELPDNDWVALRFDEAVTAPEIAAIDVFWDGAEPIALRANVPPADLGDERLLNDPYPGGELLRDHEPATGDLAFRVVPGTGVRAAAAVLGRLVRGVASGLAARPLFGVAWLLLTAGAVALAVRGLRAGEPDPLPRMREETGD